MIDQVLNEAPASATLSVITPNGYNALFTIRDVEVSELIRKIYLIEGSFEKLGYKPQPSRTFNKEQKPVEYADYVCPTCGKRVTKNTTKENKKFEACETRQYDFKTKSTTGCSYIKWID